LYVTSLFDSNTLMHLQRVTPANLCITGLYITGKQLEPSLWYFQNTLATVLGSWHQLYHKWSSRNGLWSEICCMHHFLNIF